MRKKLSFPAVIDIFSIASSMRVVNTGTSSLKNKVNHSSSSPRTIPKPTLCLGNNTALTDLLYNGPFSVFHPFLILDKCRSLLIMKGARHYAASQRAAPRAHRNAAAAQLFIATAHQNIAAEQQTTEAVTAMLTASTAALTQFDKQLQLNNSHHTRLQNRPPHLAFAEGLSCFRSRVEIE